MADHRWSDEFNNQIKELDTIDLWTLHMTEENGFPNGRLKYEQTTFGSFRCSYCKHQWSSANVHIMFLITLARACKHGIVEMKISKQSCKMCNSGTMETSQISYENMKRMIKNLVLKINRTFYEQEKYGRLSRPINYNKKQNGPHDKDHFENCLEVHQDKKYQQGWSFHLEEQWQQGLSLLEEKKSQQVGSTALAVAGVAVAGIGALALACMVFADSSKK
ncbi:receptor-transporting protein 3 isoform X2 [Xenopus laevis]|nr:receptor-transporting protein 3 isoform X2 [Xenopus laevis]XP_018121119.1 receptor-transporting protein 3 isoform X2 [Xenopus laevis]XP_041420697.1 receptor-transporting protein 3 isoform X2 [Xenopus laevis]OCT78533.1 hypothetical protein XELAEV_18029621mg [Xenopus laevis]